MSQKKMNILSLFDGMSCGQIALNRVGINYNNYYASEIDKYAIKITQKNFPNTIQLGDITKWKEWELPKIDLLMAGSPCQGFSVAGSRLNFEDPRSKLFFVFLDILNYYKPRFWFLENVKMKGEWSDIISDILHTDYVMIDSALVSAQSRRRLYWSNFPITQPEDKGILLKDIIEYGEVDRDKSYPIDANYYKGGSEDYLKRIYHGKAKRQAVKYQSSRRLMIRVGTADDVKGHDYNKRVYSLEGKSPSLAAKSGGNLEPKVALDDFHYRKLTPLECERLQTVDEGYTEGVSNTQRYRMLGNGWTIDVIAHILKDMVNYGQEEV